jgi:MerR family redox-sensitive transcriptional activator SoxR
MAHAIAYNHSVIVKVNLKSRGYNSKVMEDLTISEIAQQAGIRASAIRYYESVQLLPEPQRVSGQRRYSADILRRLAFIQVAQQAGFTVAEMRVLLNELDAQSPLSERWQTLAHQKLAEVETLIQRAHAMKALLMNGLRCHCPDLENCIDCVLINCIPQKEGAQ